MPFLTRLLGLLGAHALTDYALQDERMARWKHPASPHSPTYGPWWWWMSAHALINALGVLVVTQNTGLGLGELLVHWLTDYAKCHEWIDTETDQACHLASKLLWAWLA